MIETIECPDVYRVAIGERPVLCSWLMWAKNEQEAKQIEELKYFLADTGIQFMVEPLPVYRFWTVHLVVEDLNALAISADNLGAYFGRMLERAGYFAWIENIN